MQRGTEFKVRDISKFKGRDMFNNVVDKLPRGFRVSKTDMKENIDIFEQKSPMSGLISCDVRTMQCRWCKYAKRGRINLGHCKKYPDGIEKPNNVYFYNKACPEFKETEDLLPEDVSAEMEEKYGDIDKWLSEANTTMPLKYDPEMFAE